MFSRPFIVQYFLFSKLEMLVGASELERKIYYPFTQKAYVVDFSFSLSH